MSGKRAYAYASGGGCGDIFFWVGAFALGLLLALSLATLFGVYGITTSCSDSEFVTNRLNNITSTLDQYVVFGETPCSAQAGIHNVSRYYTGLDAEYNEIIRFDNVRSTTDASDPTRTNITYYPAVPQAPPLGSGATVNTPTLPGNTFNLTRFKVFQATPYSIGYFFGVSLATISPTSRRLATAQTSVEDRGPNNLGQRRIMAALTKNKIVCRYSDRVLIFVNNVYESWVVHRLPVLSSFRSHLIDFFLDIHLGNAAHPDFVKAYFNDYLAFIATVDSNAEARERTLRARLNNQCVRDYFESRILDVIDEAKTDTITYHWFTSGMHLEKVITEAVYNIVWFGPLVNAVNLMVNQSINPRAATPGTFGYSFLRLFYLASIGTGQLFNPLSTPVRGEPITSPFYTGSAEQLQINVVREFIRMMIPDPLSVSTDTDNNCAGCSTHTQARHSVLLIQLRAEYEKRFPTLAEQNAAPWSPPFTSLGWNTSVSIFGVYNPTKYAGLYNATYADAVCDSGCSCCLADSDRPAGLLNSINAFTTSAFDGQTLIPLGDTALIPVFVQPLYAPFGLGSTRNPYEILIQFTLLKLFDTVKCVQFVNDCLLNPQRCNPASPAFRYPLVPLAPLRAVPDSFFFSGLQCPPLV